MKRWMVMSLCVLLTYTVARAQDAKDAKKDAPPAAGAGPLGTLEQKASYGLGYSLGKNFKSQGVEVDIDLMLKGLRDGLTGAASVITDAQIEEALQQFQQNLIAKQQQKLEAQAAENLKAGAAYLKANAAKPGVKSTKSGLQYKSVTEGTGPVPKETDIVKVHYKGTLLDGTVFDSSYERKQPATFPVNGVIKGWVEALQLMKVGSKYEVAIPAELAYGVQPPEGSAIPPNSTLLFEIELLGIEKPDAAQPKAAAPEPK